MENLVSMMQKLKAVYQGKKVFLTGHTGFKGSWLLKILNMMGAEVMGYALKPENDFALYNLLNGDKHCDSVIEDLRNKNKLAEVISSFQPDYVFHLAAQPLVRLSYQIPAETFEVNAIGTANVLDGIRSLEKLCNVILITTDKVYHNYEWVHPYRENDRLGGYDPYSASKACTEIIIDSYRNSFFNPGEYQQHQKAIAVARAGNVIGGGDWSKDRLIPDIIKALSESTPVQIRNPSAIRPWQHVLEPLFGYLLLGKHLSEQPLRYSQAYNFGPDSNDALPVEKMVGTAINYWGTGEYKVESNTENPHEAGLLKLDISKAQAELSWYPKYNAETAIANTVKWYKRYLENPDEIIAFTEEQILHYINE